jgi:hypothetical protein
LSTAPVSPDRAREAGRGARRGGPQLPPPRRGAALLTVPKRLVQVIQEIGHLLLQVGGARRSLVDEVVQEVLDAKGGTLLLQGVGPWG